MRPSITKYRIMSTPPKIGSVITCRVRDIDWLAIALGEQHLVTHVLLVTPILGAAVFNSAAKRKVAQDLMSRAHTISDTQLRLSMREALLDYPNELFSKIGFREPELIAVLAHWHAITIDAKGVRRTVLRPREVKLKIRLSVSFGVDTLNFVGPSFKECLKLALQALWLLTAPNEFLLKHQEYVTQETALLLQEIKKREQKESVNV